MLEDNLLSQCFKHLWNNFPESRYKCWHVANERKCSYIEGNKLKAKGVLRGVPDLVINRNSKAYYIEFKSEKGKQSQDQIIIQQALESEGFIYFLVNSFEQFKIIIEKIYERSIE